MIGKPTAGLVGAKKLAVDQERRRAERAGTPYPPGHQIGHVPDTCLSGNPVPPAGWLGMPGISNNYVGGVSGRYVGRKVKGVRIDGVIP